MTRVCAILAAAGLSALLAGEALAQSLGGYPIREPGAAPRGQGTKPGPGGLLQVVVDANGPGPYKTVQQGVNAAAVGGVVYVMPGVYNEEKPLTLTKTVSIQGDRGPGPGVEINAPLNQPCLKFAPADVTAHAVVANVVFVSKPNSSCPACVEVERGVFTLKESDVFGSKAAPAVMISGGTVVLEKNRITSGKAGVLVAQKHTLSQTFIIDNKIGRNRVGVDIAQGSGADVVVSGNEIFDNDDIGIQSQGYGGATLIGNKIRNNNGAGVFLNRFSNLSLVRYNEIVKNRLDGIAIPFGANGIIENNEIVGNEGASIFLGHIGPQPKILNNFIANNALDGKKKKNKKTRASMARSYDRFGKSSDEQSYDDLQPRSYEDEREDIERRRDEATGRRY